jgi:L-ascorbate metabolism protein UlaG (beta-lactamase superfamily)
MYDEELAMPTIGRDTTITWLGHGTFHITTPGGRRLLIDPWIHANPAWPEEWTPRIRHEGLDAIFMTHGHFDHLPDLFTVVHETDAKIACIFDMAGWLVSKGIPEERILGFNKGGTIEVAGIRATMTTAQHSSTYNDNGTLINLGDPAGYVLRMENGFTIYHTGDTAVTFDMQIVGDLYHPDLTILPIGDWYTMDPRQAAYALKLIRSRYAIPEHYGTFPILSGTPAQLRAELQELNVQVEVIELEPGGSVS